MRASIVCAVLWSFTALPACGPSAFPEPGTPDLQSAEQRWPGTKLAELEEGRSLYLGRCGSCHRPFEPTEIPAESWRKEISEMQAQAKLNDAQAESIAKYLITMSEQASP